MLQLKLIIWMAIYLEISYQQSLYYSAFTETNINNLDNWNFLNIDPSTVISTCGSTIIVGGYQKFANQQAATKLLQLPPHYKIQISLTLFVIDTWDPDEYFQVYVDQDLSYKVPYRAYYSPSNLCGNSCNDQVHDIQFEVDHNGLTTYIYLTSTLDSYSDDESWGFRNFKLFVYQCQSGCLVCSKTDLQSVCSVWAHLHSSYTVIDQNLFNVEGWTIVTELTTQQSLCQSIPIICGSNICGKNTIISKTFYSLSVHANMKIKFKYLKLDNWGIRDEAFLKVDGNIKWSKKLSLEYQYLYSICGNNQRDVFFNVDITFAHSSASATIQILNTLDEEPLNESFGIRDIEIFIEQIICGDQIVQFSEDCDDGNIYPFDGCFNCKYSCVEGCSICHKGLCLSCFSGWMFQSNRYNCLLIVDLNQQLLTSQQIFENELNNFRVIQCHKGFNINYITNQCESICGDNFITNYEECDNQSEFCHECKFQCSSNCIQCKYGICYVCEQEYSLQNNYCIKDKIISVCQPQCNICIEGVCYQCQPGQILILGQCQEICCNNDLAIYTLEECACNLNCLEYIMGVCYKCRNNYLLINNLCFEIRAICGDNIIQEYEECDDGNDVEFDGCFDCRYSCPIGCQNCKFGICQDKCKVGFYFINNICSTICGDTIIAGLEQCEDSNSNQYDGCYQCKYSCPENCSDCFQGICLTCDLGYLLINNNSCVNICGDGILKPEEQCDDGNQEDRDGCSKLCQVETNWICQHGTDCAFVKYPIFKIEYLMRIDQDQYVQITFSQPVQSYSNICYKDTFQLEILNLNETLYNISIKEEQPAQFLVASNVQYILKIEIFTILNFQPTLQVKLTEQLYSSDSAPLQNMIDQIQLSYPNYITQYQIQLAQTLSFVSKVSIFSIYGSSAILILLGNSLSFWGILDALQQQSYLKFINVQYPETLLIYFQSSELISVSSQLDGITLINKITQALDFDYSESYQKFKYYEVNASIIDGLRTEILLFVALSLLYFITQITIQIINNLEFNDQLLQFPNFIRFIQKQKRKIYHNVIRRKNNFVKTTLLACSWDLIFMALLELNTYHELMYYRSFIRLSAAITILIITFIFILQQMNGISSWKKQNFHQFWADKKDIFILIKKVLIILILVYFQGEQVIQTLILTLINLFYLISIIKFELFQDQQEYLKILYMETTLSLFTASTFVNWNITSNYIQQSQQIIIGWIQISLLVSALILFMVLQFYNSFMMIKNKIITFMAKRQVQAKQNEQNEQNENNLNIEDENFQFKRAAIANIPFFTKIQNTV